MVSAVRSSLDWFSSDANFFDGSVNQLTGGEPGDNQEHSIVFTYTFVVILLFFISRFPTTPLPIFTRKKTTM